MNRCKQISVRKPAVAGRFFPADPGALSRTVADCLNGAGTGLSVPRAVISPHAGYPFSGRLTGAAWQATAGADTDRIVVLSPSHQHLFDGVAMPSQDRYAMPGFEVEIDGTARETLLNHELAHIENAAHDREHGVETQLPFLHRLHPAASVLPLVIGRVAQGEVERIVDVLAATRDKPPLFVLSSDLSHFLTRDAARTHDASTAKRIETGQAQSLTGTDACGATAIRGFMCSAYGRGLRVQRLAMANSADVTQDSSRTVGYGAWALYAGTDAILTGSLRTALIDSARQALVSRVREGKAPQVRPEAFPHPLRGHGAAFVTLQKDGALRGCIGSVKPRQPLISDVIENTIKSAFDDPRFPPVGATGLDRITLKIAVLSPSAPMSFTDEADLLEQLVPKRDGLILTDGKRRGIFLPLVWESLPRAGDFLAALKQKAGLPKDHWSKTLRVERFCAESFAERA